MPHFETNAVSPLVFAVRGLLESVPRTAGRLANCDAEHPANEFEHTSNGERDGQPDQQDHKRDRQRDARGSSQRGQCLKKRPPSARLPGDVNDIS